MKQNFQEYLFKKLKDELKQNEQDIFEYLEVTTPDNNNGFENCKLTINKLFLEFDTYTKSEYKDLLISTLNTKKYQTNKNKILSVLYPHLYFK